MRWPNPVHPNFHHKIQCTWNVNRKIKTLSSPPKFIHKRASQNSITKSTTLEIWIAKLKTSVHSIKTQCIENNGDLSSPPVNPVAQLALTPPPKQGGSTRLDPHCTRVQQSSHRATIIHQNSSQNAQYYHQIQPLEGVRVTKVGMTLHLRDRERVTKQTQFWFDMHRFTEICFNFWYQIKIIILVNMAPLPATTKSFSKQCLAINRLAITFYQTIAGD